MAKAKKRYHRAMQQNGPPSWPSLPVMREERSWLQCETYWLYIPDFFIVNIPKVSIKLFSEIQARIQVWEQVKLFFFVFCQEALFFAVVNLHPCGPSWIHRLPLDWTYLMHIVLVILAVLWKAIPRYRNSIPRRTNNYILEHWKGLGLTAMLCWW